MWYDLEPSHSPRAAGRDDDLDEGTIDELDDGGDLDDEFDDEDDDDDDDDDDDLDDDLIDLDDEFDAPDEERHQHPPHHHRSDD